MTLIANSLRVFTRGCCSIFVRCRRSVRFKCANREVATEAALNAIVKKTCAAAASLSLVEVSWTAGDDDGVVDRVRSASANVFDWPLVRGLPYIMGVGGGFRRPKRSAMGVGLAGAVDAVCNWVTKFKVVDEVFGGHRGSFAEFVAGTIKDFALKQEFVSFEAAPAIPIAGVTGITSTANLRLVRSLCARKVVDYTRADFATGVELYDEIVGAVGNRSLRDLRRFQTPRGTLVIVGGGGRLLGSLVLPLRALVMNRVITQTSVFFMAKINFEDLRTTGAMVETERVTPVIDWTYPLEDVPTAISRVESVHSMAK